jgi:hypothetical protein
MSAEARSHDAGGAHWMRRLAIAAGIVVVIYAVALGLGTLLYQTGAIGTGATHNTCDGLRKQLAEELHVAEDEVPQSALKARTESCLEGHELTAREAYRSEYLFWTLWPAVVVAGVYLLWPAWAAALHRQDLADAAREASRMEPGT